MENLKIDNELRDLIPPLAGDELKQLENNIVNEGWRDNERILTWDGFIIDGHNRHSICIKNNIEFKTKGMSFNDKNEVILWMIDNQLGRRNIPDFARVELNLRKKDIISANSPKGTDTREKIAKVSNVGSNTVSRVEFIRDNADEETKTKLRSGSADLSINKVYTNLKRKEKVKEIKNELKNRKPATEEKYYQIIYADPPWSYNRNVGEGIASEEYNLMTNDKIATYLLDNKIYAEKDSMLFLWVTFPMLEEGMEILDRWGFEYKTCGFNWIKLNKNGKPFFGIGHYTKSNSEICLIGIKGKGLPILDNTISQIVMTEKDKHSKKPDCIPDLIVRLVGDRKRTELFARKKREGWDVYGNEV